jgi:hypothetical protein
MEPCRYAAAKNITIKSGSRGCLGRPNLVNDLSLLSLPNLASGRRQSAESASVNGRSGITKPPLTTYGHVCIQSWMDIQYMVPITRSGLPRLPPRRHRHHDYGALAPNSPPRLAPARGPPLWELLSAESGEIDP